VAGGKRPEGQVALFASELARADTGSGAGGMKAKAPPEDAVDIALVEEPPQITNAEEMVRVMTALFPQRMAERRTEGQTVVEFVVGVDGRAEMETVRIVSSTSELFAAATREAVRRMRLSTARVKWHDRVVAVRCRVQMPLVWSLR
jgi:TonB family protein